MTETLLLLLKLAVGTIILAIGTGSTVSDLAVPWRRPALLLRSLLAVHVLVPACHAERVLKDPGR
jgi:predicted Na+-dependent transporter